jgi:hypothetical protein
MFKSTLPCALLLAALSVTAGRATTVVDATGDFLGTYGGPHDADLDVTSFSVVYNPATLTFSYSATLADNINAGTGGRYVIGVYTGNNAAPNNFAAIGAGNVLFNQAISISKTGVVTLGMNTLSAATISGNSFTGNILVSQLTGQGFTPEQYGWNLWPRDAVSMGTAAISDFAPNNAVFQASAVPEPASWAMIISGFALIGASIRRRGRMTSHRRVA